MSKQSIIELQKEIEICFKMKSKNESECYQRKYRADAERDRLNKVWDDYLSELIEKYKEKALELAIDSNSVPLVRFGEPETPDKYLIAEDGILIVWHCDDGYSFVAKWEDIINESEKHV